MTINKSLLACALLVAGSCLPLLLIDCATPIPNDSPLSNKAMSCKIQYQNDCQPNKLQTPSFRNPLCAKKSYTIRNVAATVYFTYPVGACGLADLCWNPLLTLVKHDVCEFADNDRECNAYIGYGSYLSYRWRGEKLPSPASGRRKVHMLQHCARPYDCARTHGCYEQKLTMPREPLAPEKERIWQSCQRLDIPGKWSIYFTYTSQKCLFQDVCWEKGLLTASDSVVIDGHCCCLGIVRKLGPEVLRGRIRAKSSRPYIFGRGYAGWPQIDSDQDEEY